MIRTGSHSRPALRPTAPGGHFDLPAGLPEPPASTFRIRILGQCAVNGTPVRASTTLEFVVALATSGGAMSKDGLLNRMYERDVSDSTVPTLAYRARKLGLRIEYEAGSCRYRLGQRVSIDALDVIGLARAGRPRDALLLYGGRCLPGSESPFATALRAGVEREVVAAVLASGDATLISLASRLIDHYELAESAAANTDEPAAMILSASYLSAAGF